MSFAALDMLRFGKYLFIKNRPIYITLFLTNRCNLACSHCFYWKNLNRKTGGNEFSIDEIERLSKNLKDTLVLCLTGGEPFLRDDLPEAVRAFHNNSKPKILSINTNGFLTEKIIRDAREILQFYKNPLIIELSIDGIGSEHDKIRGRKGAFEMAIKTFIGLREIAEQHGNLSLSINLTFSRLNQHKAMKTIGFIEKELRPNWLNISLIRGEVKGNGLKNVDLALFGECVGLVNEYNKKYGKQRFFLSSINAANQVFVNNLVCKTAEEKRFQTSCYAGSLSCVVYEDGTVAACEMLGSSIGNLRQNGYDLNRMMESENAEKIRERIIANRCFCTHECVATVNTLFNPMVLPKIALSYLRR